MAKKPHIPKSYKHPKPRSEQLIPNSKAIRNYWQYLKDGAKEGDYFATAALIILTREHTMALKDITDMAVLYRLFREESGKVDDEEEDDEGEGSEEEDED